MRWNSNWTINDLNEFKITSTSTNDVSEIRLGLALLACVAASTLAVRFACCTIATTLAVVFAEVVAFVHANEVGRIVGRNGRESSLAFATVHVGAGHEKANAVHGADGLVGGGTAGIRAVRLEDGTGHFGRGVGWARQTTGLLGVGLVTAHLAENASILLGKSRARLAFRF